MAELPPPVPPPPPPPPNNHGGQARARRPKTNAANPSRPMRPPHQQVRASNRPPMLPLPEMQILINLAPPITVMAPTADGYEPLLVGIGPYGNQYLFRPIGPPLPLGTVRFPMPHSHSRPHLHLNPHPYPPPPPPPPPRRNPQPQPQVNRNRAPVDAQRLGTGVFFPPAQPQIPIANNKNSRNRGLRNEQVAEGSGHQIRQPNNTNASSQNDAVVNQEEEQKDTTSPEMRLPKEWPY